MRYRLCEDVLIHRYRDGSWLVSNVRLAKHVSLDGVGMAAVMESAAGLDEAAWAQTLTAASGVDRTEFPHAVGLMIDPTGVSQNGAVPTVSGDELLVLLLKHRILINENGLDYADYLNPKTSILDRSHRGNFHQVIGQYHATVLREKHSWRWWHDQKFEPDGKALKKGLYRWVQGHFFETYFAAQALKGEKVLDFACGNGFYAGQFAAFGAKVTAVDTSPELIAIARQNHPAAIDFILPESELACQAWLSAQPSASYDRIYLSDALLFFFHDMKTNLPATENLRGLIGEFRRLLKPGGVFNLMEPNATFWLSPWLGSAERPFTAVSEYRHRRYKVAPTPDAVIGLLGACNLLVRDFRHPDVSPEAKVQDAGAYHFAKEYPLWDFYVAEARG